MHTGKRTSKRLLKALNTPWIEYDEKILASSLKDYQSDNKMKNLSIRSGFQRKATAFLMEDTYLTVEQLNKFLMKEKVKKRLRNKKNGYSDIYGGILKTKTKLQIKSRMEGYGQAITLHVVKINDLNQDVRKLIKLITHNKEDNIAKRFDVDEALLSIKNLNLNNESKTEKSNLRNTNSEVNEEITDRAKGYEIIKKAYEEIVRLENSCRGEIFGKFNQDEQLTEPILDNLKNKITITFERAIHSDLNDSSLFRDRAQIVRTFYK